MAELKVDLILVTHVCPCGTAYALPSWVTAHACPMCAQRRIEDLVAQACVDHGARENLERRIAALKGALTKSQRHVRHLLAHR
jgi:hypothetical protein